MIDEFSARIEAQLKEQDEYPERFEIVRVCDSCGELSKMRCCKDEVARYVAKHGSNEMRRPFCERCWPDEGEEDDD